MQQRIALKTIGSNRGGAAAPGVVDLAPINRISRAMVVAFRAK
jgi:hypothetical protein